MKTIPLTQGQVALVDDEDFERLNRFKWCSTKNFYGVYIAAIRACYCPFSKKRHTICMHRQIMSCPQGKEIDHKDHNIFNNQKYNLRICTHAENTKNKKRNKNNTSGFKGVWWNKGKVYKGIQYKGIWQAGILLNGEKTHLGSFNFAIEAARAYDKAARELFGEFAYTNF